VSGADTAWLPFEGRIWPTAHVTRLPIILFYGPGGLEITVDWLVRRRDATLHTWTGAELDARRYLGSGLAPEFIGGPGLPPFDWLVRDVPLGQLCPGPDRLQISFPPDDIRARLRNLHASMTTNASSLIGKPWPLQPGADYQMIRADELSVWSLEPATGFAKLFYTDDMRCDLRVVSVSAEARPLPTLADLAEQTNADARVTILRALWQRDPRPLTGKNMTSAGTSLRKPEKPRPCSVSRTARSKRLLVLSYTGSASTMLRTTR
jgi:hypothetical protein